MPCTVGRGLCPRATKSYDIPETTAYSLGVPGALRLYSIEGAGGSVSGSLARVSRAVEEGSISKISLFGVCLSVCHEIALFVQTIEQRQPTRSETIEQTIE